MKTNLKMACVSDIHLGNKKNTAAEIIKNLREAFPDNAETGDLDIIFIAGDVFDGLLSLPDDEVTEIDLWIAHMLNVCAKHDILLRILDGTKSHDWYQSKRFESIHKVMASSVDMKYVRELSVEYIDKLGIDVLYVPDEATSSTEKTLLHVKELLRAKGIEQVDFAIMHGAFTFQLPEHVKAHKHNPDEYLKLVRHLIFVGHVHTFSRYQRIIAQGSVDRLAHGEEGPKGHVRVTITDTGYDVVFVENKNAKTFKTVDCTGLSLDDTIIKVDSGVKGLRDGSHIRVRADMDNPIISNMTMLVRRYPLLVWSKITNEVEAEESAIAEQDEFVYIPITITSSNITNLLLNRMSNSDISPDVTVVAEEILKDII
jgi:DNA repair exonuclease SbcCD nuclease subunit